jgi:hypothetical protein
VKFHSNLTQADQFTAENAGQRNVQQDQAAADDTNRVNYKIQVYFYFYLTTHFVIQGQFFKQNLNIMEPLHIWLRTVRAGSSAGMNA